MNMVCLCVREDRNNININNDNNSSSVGAYWWQSSSLDDDVGLVSASASASSSSSERSVASGFGLPRGNKSLQLLCVLLPGQWKNTILLYVQFKVYQRIAQIQFIDRYILKILWYHFANGIVDACNATLKTPPGAISVSSVKWTGAPDWICPGAIIRTDFPTEMELSTEIC